MAARTTFTRDVSMPSVAHEIGLMKVEEQIQDLEPQFNPYLKVEEGRKPAQNRIR